MKIMPFLPSMLADGRAIETHSEEPWSTRYAVWVISLERLANSIFSNRRLSRDETQASSSSSRDGTWINVERPSGLGSRTLALDLLEPCLLFSTRPSDPHARSIPSAAVKRLTNGRRRALSQLRRSSTTPSAALLMRKDISQSLIDQDGGYRCSPSQLLSGTLRVEQPTTSSRPLHVLSVSTRNDRSSP